jgi:acyl carrier protein
MSESFERVARVFAEVFACEPGALSMETVPEDVPTWDSLGHMSLVGALEDEFGIRFEVDEIMEMVSVGRIIEIIEAR